jgi:sugar phosphate isomerase/epimerase
MVKKSIEWAAGAGIHTVHFGDGHLPQGMSAEDGFKRLEDRLLALLEVAEKNNVVMTLEPHGSFSLTEIGLKKIMAISPSKYLGINYDCANVFRAGYVESKNGSSHWVSTGKSANEVTILKSIIDRVVHFHAKDIDNAGNCVALGTGNVSVKECINELEKIGYEGVVSLESEGEGKFEVCDKLARDSYKFLKKHVR